MGALATDTCLRVLHWEGAPFAAVQLPISRADFTICADRAGPRATAAEEDTVLAAFTLWGLTLSMINDLSTSCGLRSHPIDMAAVHATSRL